MMKKLLLTLLLFASVTLGFAQIATDGDYRSAATGNWSNLSSWQIRSSGTWSAATSVPTAANNIYIQNLHIITVDVSNAYCKDFQINTSGVLAIGTNIMNVNGKIRAYTGVAEVTSSDGSYVGSSTTTLVSAMITTSGSGVLKFVGGTRNITTAGEWNSNSTSNAVEFALDAGAIGTLSTVGVKFKPIVFSSGTVTTDAFISVSTGDLTVKSGARLISSRSSSSDASTSIIGNSSSAPAGIVTIESGGILELTGSSPRISCNTFVNNGTVIYSRAGSQTLLQPATVTGTAGTATFNNYSTLIFANTSSKTLSTATTVSKLLQFTGIASLNTGITTTPTAFQGFTLTMANNSKIDRSVTSGTSISSGDAINVFYGSLSTDIVNVDIGTTISASNEVPASPTPGKVGTLTIANGVVYTFTGSRSVTDLVNNGSIVFTPGTSLTFTINGKASGTGTVTSNLSTGNSPNYYSTTLAFTSTTDKGILYLDQNNKELRFLTLTGAGALTLGNSITLNSPFTLSDNTAIALGTASNVSFAASQAASWTSGKTLTITGWTGTAGTSGTAGKVFFGSTSSDLTALQISQIVFNVSGTNYGAMLLSNGELVPTNTPLPVKLTSFTASKQGAAVQLKWSTASEQNNRHFEIQRSTDGQSFATIGNKVGAGNSSSVLDYFFTDRSPSSGVNYYRLNQIDFDGKSTLSDPIAVSFGSGAVGVMAYPNPVVNQLNVSGLVAGDRIKLLDLSGRIIKEQAFSGSNSSVLNLDKINAGVYLLIVENLGNITFKSKIVKN